MQRNIRRLMEIYSRNTFYINVPILSRWVGHYIYYINMLIMPACGHIRACGYIYIFIILYACLPMYTCIYTYMLVISSYVCRATCTCSFM